MPRAVYPGTFDPFTHGHRHLVEQALAAGLEVVVAVGDNPAKKTLFTAQERVALAKLALHDVPQVQVVAFGGLLSHILAQTGASMVVRGLRNTLDFTDNLRDDDYLRAHGGVPYAPFYVPPAPEFRNTSTTLLKAACAAGANLLPLANVSIAQALLWRMRGQRIIGVTGASGAGKSYLCAALVAAAKGQGIEAHHIEADVLVHRLYASEEGADAARVRQALGQNAGAEVLNAQGFIDKAVLSQKVLAKPALLKDVERLVFPALTLMLQREMLGLKGLVLVDAPTLVEAGWLPLVHNHVLWVGADEATRRDRLEARYGTNPEGRMAWEPPIEARLSALQGEVAQLAGGKLWQVASDAEPVALLNEVWRALDPLEGLGA